MPKLHQKYLDSVKNRVSSSSNNLLAMAAPLESSAAPTKMKSTPSGTKSVEAKDPAAQKAMLTSALLAVGCVLPALALLSRFPWLIDVHREIADLLLRILKTSISPLFETTFNKGKYDGYSQPRARYASAGVLTTPTRKPMLTLCAPPPPSTHTHDFVFFFPRWSDWIPICRSLSDIADIVEPIMRFIGIHISRDPLFMTKLLRLGKVQLMQSVSFF